MSEVIKLYKNLGETPLECIKRLKGEYPKYQDTKMTYLGRLDPMAEGLLLVLAGNTRNKNQYLELDKTYEFEVLWGVATDTYDVLGKILKRESSLIDENKINSLLKKILNKKTQVYPAFSSKSFKGDFMWARENKVEEFDRPERGIKIFDIRHIHTRLVTGKEILEEVTRKISLVKGDFRQDEILGRWNQELGIKNQDNFMISKFVADVSSGTYIRGLANEMGELLNSAALAYSIKRTRVGEYKI